MTSRVVEPRVSRPYLEEVTEVKVLEDKENQEHTKWNRKEKQPSTGRVLKRLEELNVVCEA